MIRVAIVEDTQRDSDQLVSFLEQYSREKGTEFSISTFPNAIQFLQQYRGEYDMIFMDIDMPVLNGMNAAQSLREIDPSVMLIFVTALARYAVNGYEVNAFDFIVKPIQYNLFAAKMTRAVKRLAAAVRKKLLIRSGDKSVRVYVDEILYVEILGHNLTFHTERQSVSTRGSLKDAMEALEGDDFALCNKSCFANLHHVEMIDGDEAVMDNGDRLQISRPRKTEFMQQIADYYSNKKINMGRF